MNGIIGNLIEHAQVFPVFSPVADGFNTGPNSAPISMKNFEKLTFLVSTATAGTNTGTGTFKVYAASSAASSNAEAVIFKYAKKTTGASDTWGAVTEAVAATGVTTVANESTTYVIEVDAADLPSDKPWVYLDTTEVVNDPVTLSAVAIGLNAKYGYPFATALS